MKNFLHQILLDKQSTFDSCQIHKSRKKNKHDLIILTAGWPSGIIDPACSFLKSFPVFEFKIRID